MNTAPNQQQEQHKQPRDPAVWPTLQAHDAIALIDFLVDRLQRAPRGGEPTVEDIPIA